MGLEQLKRDLKAKGGQSTDWEFILGGGLSHEDLVPFVGEGSEKDVMERAREVMSPGRMVEYECYDQRWRSQGKAIIELVSFEDERENTVRAIHLAASDGYYGYYADEKLRVDNVVYHLCCTEAKKCTFRLPRGDRRELVHLARWRMVNPGGLLLEGWTKDVAMAAIREAVEKFTPPPVAPIAPVVAPAAVGGSGLDEALAAEAAGGGDRRDRREERSKRGREAEKKARGSVGQLLQEKARVMAEKAETERQQSRRKRKRERSRDDRRRIDKRSRGPEDDSYGSDSKDDVSSEESDFQKPPTRGGADIWKLAKKNPGRLLKSGMEEMSRYLADRVGDGQDEIRWDQRRVMAYINQILLVGHQGGGPGVRNQREAVTLGTAIDLLLSGSLASLGDLLMQRLKALETAMQEQNWQAARHQELISPQTASLTNPGERELASRTEIRMMKLRAATMKAKGSK